MAATFYRMLAKQFPRIKLKLKQAGMTEKPYVFIKTVFMSAMTISGGMLFGLIMIFAKLGKPLYVPILLMIPFSIISFFYFTKLPDLQISRRIKEIDREIVFVGQFMILEINSGVPLYQVLKNIAQNYGGIGTYFQEIVRDIDFGTETQEAIANSIVMNPSDNYQKVMLQLSNSLRTGADLSLSLTSVLDQITRKQMVEVEKYGKKLNPIAMFYLMIAVIIPSLGMVMGVIIVSFINVKLTLGILLVIAGVLGFFQFMFYTIIKSSRPAVDI